MFDWRSFLRAAGLMAATTVGAGLFALPYIFTQSGWLLSGLYLAILSALLAFTHSLYFRALAKVHERDRLLGLVRDYLGRRWEGFGFLVIVGGLLLALVIYLILAGQFLFLFSSALQGAGVISVVLTPGVGLFLFWLFGSLPLLFGLRRLVASELWGFVLMVAVIFVIFFGVFDGGSGLASLPRVNLENFFLPFGAIVFALAGWTAVEPIYDYAKKTGLSPRRTRRAMAWGTIVSAALYAMFVLGILGSAPNVAPDTLGGLVGWPFWKFSLLIVLGLFAMWTSYVPISVEIKNALEKDLRWPKAVAIAVVFFLPFLLYLFGLRDFLSVIGLAGGVFLGLEYFLILRATRSVLTVSPARRVCILVAAAVFLLAAAYEIYYFVIR